MSVRRSVSHAGSTAKSGIPNNSQGGSNVDPTKNVLDLVESAITRIDDLRDAETRRTDQLTNAESRRVDDIANIRAQYEEKLREAEAKRIDAIRAVDVNAVAVAAERSSAQATVLANQVVQSAEALRALVASTAATVATQLQNLSAQLTDRISALEKSQYEISGRSTVSNPADKERMDALTKAVEGLVASRNVSSGRGSGFNASWAYLLGAVGLVGTLLAILWPKG